MLSELEYTKLVSRITTVGLDQKQLDKYQQIEDALGFWRAVTHVAVKMGSRAVAPTHPLNENIERIAQSFGLPNEAYHLLHNPTSIAVPFLLQTRSSDQYVSYLLFSALLEQYDEHTQPQLWRSNMLLCAQISLSKKWSTKYDLATTAVSMSKVSQMWCEAYTHLPEENLFKAPERFSYFAEAITDVFPIVKKRCPHNLGKLMDAALQDCMALGRDWVSERYIEDWNALWSQLSANHWAQIKLPSEKFVCDRLQDFIHSAHQKCNILDAIQPSNHIQFKRKM